MELNISDIESTSTTDYHVGKLQKWLDYELSAFVLWVAGYYAFHLWFYTLIAASAAAVIFIPVLLNILRKEERYGWIISFFAFIVIPSLIAFISLNDSSWKWIPAIVSIGFFYFYCGILRFVIREW